MAEGFLIGGNSLARIGRVVHAHERTDPPPQKLKRPRSKQPAGATMMFGVAGATWTAGNTISLTPCVGPSDSTATGEAARTVYIYLPTDHVPIAVLIETGDILGFFPFQEGGVDKGVLASVPLDIHDCDADEE